MKEFIDYGIQIPAGATAEVAMVCPRCSHERKKPNDKCLSVNVTKGTWNCKNCGWADGLKSGLGSTPKPTPVLPKPIPESAFPESALKYLKSRCLPMEVIERNKIKFTSHYMPQDQAVQPAFAFPYFRDGKLINHKYLDSHKHYCLDGGAELILYGLDDIANTTIFVEGEQDKLAVEAAGYRNCVSVPNGAPPENADIKAADFKFLEADEKRLLGIKTVILAGDNDGPGEKLQAELARRLGPEKCKRVTWPEGCKDANDTLMHYGVEGITEAMDDMRDWPVAGMFSFTDLTGEIFNVYDGGGIKGVYTGWMTLDSYYSVVLGQWTLVTGVPSHGKSTWLDCLQLNLIRREGWPFAVFSPENAPLEHYCLRLLEKWLGRPAFGPDRMSKEEIQAGMASLNPFITFLLDDQDEGMTLDWILDQAKVAVFRKGIRGLIMDPWNEIEHQRPKEQSETEYISACLTKIRRFAREHQVHVWLVAHPMKPERGKGKNWIPGPYDVSGSANWRNKADNCISIWRDTDPDTYSQTASIHIQKIRFKETGKMGRVDLVYLPKTSTYRDLSYR